MKFAKSQQAMLKNYLEFNMELEQRIQKIEQRNYKVEQDKAWETSLMRKATISVITYFIAAWFMYLIKVEHYWSNAFIPTVGYILSTLSIPVVKQYWLKYFYKSKN